MTFNSLYTRFIYLISAFLVFCFACTKTETITRTEIAPCVRFSTLVTNPYGVPLPIPGTSTSIDSNFYFRNESDSGLNMTYKWDFGDGDTSSLMHPTHKYSKRGNYRVTLTTTRDKIVSDTSSLVLSVYLGLQHVALPGGESLTEIGIQQNASGEFVLLAFSGYNADQFHIFHLDTLLKVKKQIDLPTSNRFWSIAPAGDGNFVCTGTTSGLNERNEFIKINADGMVIWSKQLTPNDELFGGVSTSDGGYIVNGSRSVSKPNMSLSFNTLIIKTDASGNTIWEKVMDSENIINTSNTIPEADGIVFSGIARSYVYSTGDSVTMSKLSYSGQLLWRKTIYAGLNTDNWGGCMIRKFKDGNYGVVNTAKDAVFEFSSQGDFLDRKLASNQIVNFVESENQHMILLISEGANGNRMRISRMSRAGFLDWNKYTNIIVKMPDGSVSYGGDSYPGTMIRLTNSGTLSLARRVNSFPTFQYSILLMPMDDSGNPL